MLELMTLALVVTCAWAQQEVLQYRHNLQRAASQPDVAEFSLSNLEEVANAMLSGVEQRNTSAQRKSGVLRNPFAIPVNCDPNAWFRTINGTCNNLIRGRQGASKTPLARLTPARYQDGIQAPQSRFFISRGALPTSREVSLAMLAVSSNESRVHSHLLAVFGQFTDHDISLSPESRGEEEREGANARCCEVPVEEYTEEHKDCLPILTPNDPIFEIDCIPFLRSAPVPYWPGSPHVRNQLNDLTAYIDSSNVYGSTDNIASSLRSFQDGLLRSQTILNEEVLPDSEDNLPTCLDRATRCRFATGNVRNTVQDDTNPINDLPSFINRADKAESLLRFANNRLLRSPVIRNENLSGADDGLACTESRMRCQFAAGDSRNSEQASLTSMHTILLREHNRIARELKRINPRWGDERLYQETRRIVGAIMQRITYREWLPEVIGPQLIDRFGLQLLNGERRFRGYANRTDPTVVTEFSTAAFRFGHNLIRQTFSRSPFASLDLRQMFNSFDTVNEFGANGLAGGLLRDQAENFDTIVNDGLQNVLFGEEADLFAFNINRGRDHGLGSYNDVRRSLGLTDRSTFSAMVDRTHSLASVNSLRSIYPKTEDIELFPAGISELPLPGAVVGETFGTIIAEQFSRMRRGDRFWHETPDRRIGFNNPQLREIRKASMARLFCDNVPGAPIRRRLFLLNSQLNPELDCSQIPRIDLSRWRE